MSYMHNLMQFLSNNEDLLPFLSFEIREPSDSQLTLFVLSCLAEVVQRLCSAAGRRSALLRRGLALIGGTQGLSLASWD